MRIKKSAFMLSSVAIMSLFAGCQEYEFTDITAEEIRYEKNFTEKFGDISNVPTWDFSTYNLNRLGLVGGPSYNNAATRATGAAVYENDSRWFYVPAGIEQWLTAELKEENDNRSKGTKDFTLSMPSNDVLLIPVYQGKAGMVWDLYVTDGQIDNNTGAVSNYSTNEKIWSKSSGIQVKKAGTGSSGITYTDEVVATRTFDYKGYQRMNTGNNDKYIPLYDYLVEMGFNASTQWVKVEVSNIDPLFTQGGLQYITEDWHNFPSSGKTISGGSVTFECKDEEFLRYALKSTGAEQVKLGLWNQSDSYDNSRVNHVTITTYKKTTGTTSDSDWTNITNLSSNEVDRNTIGETIRAHAIKLKQNAFSGGNFSMYLNITTSNSEYANRANQASTAGQMLALTELNTNSGYLASVLAALQDAYGSEDYKFMFLGCEDANTNKVDWDMNDIVFLLVGEELPEIHSKDDKIIKKRYMIEDLGSSYDFDFNDIVVDVTEVTKYNDDATNTIKSITQTAELKHLCGTIPFQIGFGSGSDIYWFPIMPGQNGGAQQGGDGYTPTGDSYSTMLNATNNLYQNGKHYWDPNNNNIYVRVWPSAAEALPEGTDGSWSDEQKEKFLGVLGSTTFAFPTTGECPYIIATNQNVQWMKELITIPTSWFTVTPKNNNPQYGDYTPSQDDDDQGDDTTPNTDLNKGPVTIASKSDGNYNQAYYTFDNDTADGLQTGDVLVITADKNNFELVFNNDWDHIYKPESKGNNTYELVLTADQVSAIKSDPRIILNGGNNVTISALTVRKGSGGQQGGGTTYTKDQLNPYGNNNGIAASYFTSNTKVTVVITSNNNGAPATLTELTTNTTVNKEGNSYTFEFTGGDLTNIKTSGFRLGDLAWVIDSATITNE